MKSKLRPLGDITDDLEILLQEMVYKHKLQAHEIYGIISSYLEMHCPDAIEKFTDGTDPVRYYGHKDGLKK